MPQLQLWIMYWELNTFLCSPRMPLLFWTCLYAVMKYIYIYIYFLLTNMSSLGKVFIFSVPVHLSILDISFWGNSLLMAPLFLANQCLELMKVSGFGLFAQPLFEDWSLVGWKSWGVSWPWTKPVENHMCLVTWFFIFLKKAWCSWINERCHSYRIHCNAFWYLLECY